MRDEFLRIWVAQGVQQRELGLSPSDMSAVDRRRTTTDLMMQLHEEVTELGQVGSTYKRHLLAEPETNPHDAAEDVADVLKTVLALAQIHGLNAEEVLNAFHRKTMVVRSRAMAARTKMDANPVICVDMDDCISDLSSWGRELAEAREGAEASQHVWAMLEKRKDEFYKQGRFSEMPPVEGAPEAMRTLRDYGFKLVIVTARPQWQYKRLYADTLEWLQRHDVPFDHVLFNKDKVEAVYEHLAPAWPVAFIEDHPRNATALAEAGMRVLLMDHPTNQGVSGPRIQRVAGWAEILQELLPASAATERQER